MTALPSILGRARFRTCAIGTALVGLALGLRAWGLGRANELFIDEITYARLALTTSHGHWPNLSGRQFYLHPPGAFLIDGAVVRVLGLSSNATALVPQLRWVNAVLGTVIVGLVFALLTRLTRTSVAIIGTLIVATDPFVLRNDGRVMLETPAVALLLTGWLLLLIALDRDGVRRRVFLLSGGFALGLSVLTKDMAAVPALLPILIAPLWRRTIPRRQAALALGAGVAPYLGYLIALAATGRIGGWWDAKGGGVRRMLGLDQTTGFNAAGAPGLTGTLTDQLSRFGSSYVLLALAVPAGLLALTARRADRRFIGIGTTLVGLLGLFSLGFGTLEEQMGYFVVVPGVISLGIAFAEPPAVISRLLSRRPRIRPAMVGLAAALTLASVAFGLAARSVTDDGYQRARIWMDANLPPGARIGMTSPTSEFAFRPGDGRDMRTGAWASLTALRHYRAGYVLTQSRPLEQGYGYASPDLVPWLDKHATALFQTYGPTGGDTVLWKLDPKVLAVAVKDGTKIPVVPSAAELGIAK